LKLIDRAISMLRSLSANSRAMPLLPLSGSLRWSSQESPRASLWASQQRLCAALPLSGLVIETNSPSMNIFEKQKGTGVPEDVPAVVSELARLIGIKEQEVSTGTTRSCARCLGLPDEWARTSLLHHLTASRKTESSQSSPS
jgi:hypothetical protein